MQFPTVAISTMPRPSVEASVHLRVESVERFSGNVHRVRDELDAVATGGSRVLIACQTEAECHRLTDVLAAGQLAQSLGWEPRRMNSAICYLERAGVIDARHSLASEPWRAVHLIAGDETLRFARSQA